MLRLAGLATMAVLAMAGAARAAGTTSAPVSTAPDQTDQQIAAWMADDEGGEAAPEGEAAETPDQAPRRIHGEASVTFASNGLRAVAASADIPVGETSDLGVAASDVSFGRHGGEARSLAISLHLGPDALAALAAPCGLHHSVPLLSDARRAARCATTTP